MQELILYQMLTIFNICDKYDILKTILKRVVECLFATIIWKIPRTF